MSRIIKLFAFITQVCVVFSVRNITSNITAKNNIVDTCIVDIFMSKTLHGADLVIIRSDVIEDDLIRQLHDGNNIGLYLKDYDVSVNITPRVYLVHCDDKETFENVIDRLDRDWYRQPSALFVIVLMRMPANNLPTIFEVLWDYHIIHVLVIIEDAADDASVYSYLPYAAGRCGRGSNTIKMGQCKSIRDFDVIDKLREIGEPNLTNCTFNVLAHYFPPLVLYQNQTDIFKLGIERFLVTLLLEQQNVHINLTLVPETADFGFISDNFTVTGSMERLYENEFDLLFGGFSLSYKRAVLFDFIYTHLAFEDIFIPVTPKADLEDRWKFVYMMFQYKVWLLLLFIMSCCALLLTDFNSFLISRYNKSSELLKLFGNATQNTRLRLREKLFQNVVISHWLWFIFLMSCYYQTMLTSYTTYRAYKPQLNEYMSLKDYNLTPCLPQSIAAFFKSSELVPIINEQYLETRDCETADLALDEVAKSSSKYTVTTYYRYLWWAARRLREGSQVHLMTENLHKTHYALFFRRGFPLLHQFKATMARIVENGFVQAIKGLYLIPDESRSASNAAGAFEVRLLTLHDLIIPFTILVAGYLIALVMFIIELAHRNDRTIVLY